MRAYLKNLRDEAETTLRVMYALRQFRLLLSEKDSVDKVNENPHFWIIYETSARTNMFIGIRRLFESKYDTFNFQKFVQNCMQNIGDFSSEPLRSRKLAGSDNAEEWIDEYMETVHEPSEEEFTSLFKLVRPHNKSMKGIYTDAASKIYAHAVHVDEVRMKEFEEKLNFEEIEEALTAIWHVHQQVWQMYENGRKPVIEIQDYPYIKEVTDSVEQQLHAAET